MKYNLLESYKLYKRLNKLESLVYEKTVSRGDDSRAYKIWKYLRDEGPKTRPEIRDHFGWTTPIVDMEAEQCVFKNGNRYSANLDYNWEDVGVIPRTAAQELANQVNDSNMETVDDDEVAPARVSARRTRQPRSPRSREVKPNLFSRKFDEVKAAVDAGADVNQRNDTGKTPLQVACSDKNGKSYDIVKLLLDHGALPWLFGGRKPNIYALLDGGDTKSILEFANAITRNNYEGIPDLEDLILGDASYKGQYPLYYAIKECNITDTNILTALTCEGWYNRFSSSCVNDICYNFYKIGKISANTWTAIANKAVHNVSIEELYSRVNAGTIAVEIQKGGPTPVLNAFTSLGYTPPFIAGYSLKNLDKAVLEKYYDLLVNVVNGKLHSRLSRHDFLNFCSDVCDLLGRSSEFAYNFIDENYIKNADGNELDSVISQLIYNKKPKILAKIAKLKPNNLDKKHFMSIVNSITDTDVLGSDSKSITSAVCRILNNIKVKPNMRLLSWQLNDLRNSDNEYLIEYLFERDLADMLMFGISDINKSSLLSPTVKKVANKYGYNKTWDEASIKERADKVEYDDILAIMISRIESDDWNADCQRWIESHQEALREKELVEAVNNNLENSITARQIKRMIDRLPDSTNDDKEIYDF